MCVCVRACVRAGAAKTCEKYNHTHTDTDTDTDTHTHSGCRDLYKVVIRSRKGVYILRLYCPHKLNLCMCVRGRVSEGGQLPSKETACSVKIDLM